MAASGEKALHAALKKREFDPVYYFHGEDDFLKEARTRDLIEAAVDPSTRDFNLEVRRCADVDAESLDALLSTPPMLAERRVVVLRDVDKLKKDARKLLDRYLKHAAPDLLLVLVTPAGVKEDKGLAAHGTVVEFAPLTGERLPRWVAYHAETLGRTITPEAVSLLIEAVGADLAMLAVELEKLASFSTGEIDEGAVSAVVGVRRGESMADLLDAIGAKDAARALALVPGVLQQPKNTAVFIVMALTVQTLALSAGVASREAGTSPRAMFNEYMGLLKETGAFPYRSWGDAVGAWSRVTDQWTAPELDRALEALLAADMMLKETRLSSEEQMLVNVVLALCGGGSTRRRVA